MPFLKANYQNSYLEFRSAMHDLLVYDLQYLGLNTLKAQIVGKNKSYIMSLLLNVQKVKEAWLALDREYGNLDLSQLGMLAELSKLCEREPADELAENKNIVKVLGFYNIAS